MVDFARICVWEEDKNEGGGNEGVVVWRRKREETITPRRRGKGLVDAVLEEVAPTMIKHEWTTLQEYVSGRKKGKEGGRKGWFGGLMGKEKKQ
jgi:hypothetical protein